MSAGAFSKTAITTLTTIVEINTVDMEYVLITFTVGTEDLTAFEVAMRAHDSGGYAILASTSGEFTTPAGVVVDATGNLTAAAAGSTVHGVLLRCGGAKSVRIRASSAGHTATMSGHANAATRST